MKRLEFINRRLREKNEAMAYINNVDEVMLEYYRVFAKQTALTIWTWIIRFWSSARESEKKVSYYLLQWAQALQHMPYTNTLKKRDTKRNYIKHTMRLIIFGLVSRQRKSCIKLRLCGKKYQIVVSQTSSLAKFIYHLQKKYIILIMMWQNLMSNTSFIWFTCPIIFLKETRTDIS